MIVLCGSSLSPKNCRETGLCLVGRQLRNHKFHLTLCKCCFPGAFNHFRSKTSQIHFGFFFCPWDFLENMCLSQICLRDYIIPIIPLCHLSTEKNCKRRTDYTNEANLDGLLTQIIYDVGKSFCSHLFWMEMSKKKRILNTNADVNVCEAN